MSTRDKAFLFVFLLSVFWFCLLRLSGCQIVDSPFGFVSGCDNYGVDWNLYLAPSGMIVLFALPVSALYLMMQAPRVLRRVWRMMRG